MNSFKLRAARKRAGMTQNKLADELGINRATISKYESGVIEPSVLQLKNIAEKLNIDLYDLIDSGFGALDAVLPPNMQGVNLDHAKVDPQFLSVLLTNLSHLDKTTTTYVRARNALFALAESSGLSNMAIAYISELECIPFTPQNNVNNDITARLKFALDKLNEDGQQKAVERVEELTEIPKYQRQEPPAAPSEGTDTAPTETAATEPPEGK